MTSRDPIVFIDVLYRTVGSSTTAQVGVVWAESWLAGVAMGEATLTMSQVEDYEPGKFYRRELPCLLIAVEHAESALRGAVGGVVIDGNVRLDQRGRAGLGLHLRAATDERFPVIGVAKRPFKGLEATEVLRGGSQNPLIVTASGIPESEAASIVGSMAGPHRTPTLIKRADQLSRL